MMHERFMGHQRYVLLCTETTISNPPVVHSKSSCDVHLLRSLWLINHSLDRSALCFTEKWTTFDSTFPRQYLNNLSESEHELLPLPLTYCIFCKIPHFSCNCLDGCFELEAGQNRFICLFQSQWNLYCFNHTRGVESVKGLW